MSIDQQPCAGTANARRTTRIPTQRQPQSKQQSHHRVVLGGTPVDLWQVDDVMATVERRLLAPAVPPAPAVPLAVASANLDHIHHFGAGTMGADGAGPKSFDAAGNCPQWLVLLDGMPLVRRAKAMTGVDWPQLAGSDLLPGLLAVAERVGATTGFLGGTSTMQQRLREVIALRYPGLRLSGMWAPERHELTDPQTCAQLAVAIRDAGTELLVVGLGKPLQERWIQCHARLTGARVLLAFGASTDFLAGTATRAPDWIRRTGLEWLYRLTHEPRRLARRYCLQAPVALRRLRLASRIPPAAGSPHATVTGPPKGRPGGELCAGENPAPEPAVFAAPGEPADCGLVIITYRSSADACALLDTVPDAAPGMRLRVIVVDNDSRDGIAELLADRERVTVVPAGANLGYAGAINLARRHLDGTGAVLVLNPDLRLHPGSVRALYDALRTPGVGVTVPQFVNDGGGAPFRSLRREPTLLRALGEALCGDHWSGRPGWLSEMVRQIEPYHRTGDADWATGAAVMITADANATIGAWDDRFFLYCEETDYLRRVREAGWSVRYVPQAVVSHRGGGSGTGPDLVALGAVNRIRYYRKYHGRLATAAFRGAVALEHALRAHRRSSRRALRAVLNPGWSR